ncbi:chemotaxis protein [Acinetobacter baumannii]
MPLPFLLIGAAAAATAVGAKKAYDGHKKKNDADEILVKAKDRYTKYRNSLDKANEDASFSLEKLGDLELRIGADFAKFDKLIEEILQNNNFKKLGNITLDIPQHKLNQIKEVAISATDYLKTVVAGGVSGAATGFAVYGGVLALGAASTGTPIAALSGVAAYNATMAAIGGGSLAAGGWGMAGGAMVLGGAVVAPVLAVAGIAYGMHGSKALKNAEDVEKQVERAVGTMAKAKRQLVNVNYYSEQIKAELEKIYEVFGLYVYKLQEVNEIVKQGDEEKIIAIVEEANLTIQNGISLAAIMAKLISKPLFKLKIDIDGKILIDKDGNPEILTDKDGMQVLDKEGLTEILEETKQNFKAAN